MRAWAVVVVVTVACSPPGRPRERQPDHVFIGALGDRQHAVDLYVKDGLGQARATAPRAGTWWYRIHFPPRERFTSQITIRASHVDGRPERVRLDVFDGANELAGVLTSGDSTVSLPERPEPLEPLVVRVTTTHKARFYLGVHVESTYIPKPPGPPPCDVHKLDAANPNCAGVLPHCNLEDPDFSNPDCCTATCGLGELRCRAKVTSGSDAAADIAIGTSQHVMRYATGMLYQRGKAVSQVLVLMVKEDTSFVQILSPMRVEGGTLAENGEVVLWPPEQCRRR